MAKKLSLNIDYSSSYTMIGISSPMKDYRLTFNINNVLNLQLKKLTDFEYILPNKSTANFSLYHYYCEELQNAFCLLSNHHPEGKLIKQLKQLDYFLFIQNAIDNSRKKILINSLKGISNVQAIFEISLSDVRNISTLIMELELHLGEFNV